MQTKPRPPCRDLETQHGVSIAYVMPELGRGHEEKTRDVFKATCNEEMPQDRGDTSLTTATLKNLEHRFTTGERDSTTLRETDLGWGSKYRSRGER